MLHGGHNIYSTYLLRMSLNHSLTSMNSICYHLRKLTKYMLKCFAIYSHGPDGGRCGQVGLREAWILTLFKAKVKADRTDMNEHIFYMRKAWVLHYAPNKPRIHSSDHNCKLLCKEHWLTHLVSWCLTKRRCESKININVKRERLIHEDKRGAERGERAVHSHDKVRTREGKISTKGKFQNHQPGNLLLDVFGSPTKPGTWKGKVPPFLLLPWTFGREHLNN